MNLSEQAARLSELRDQILTLADTDGELSEEDSTRYEALNAEFDELRASHDADFERAATYAVGLEAVRSFEAGQFEAGDANRANRAPAFHREVDPYDAAYQSDVGTREAALRAIGECRQMDGDSQTEAERKLKASAVDPNLRRFDEYVLRHNSPDYSRGVIKLINGRGWEMTPAEVSAVRETQMWDEERGLTLTAANGGALIPAHLDPTVVLTNVGTSNPFRSIARVVPIMTNVWNGVSSAGVTMAWSTEAGDSSDVAPTFLQPTVTCAKGHGTIPVSIEAFEDIGAGLGGEIARLIQDGKDRLEGTAFVSGSGSGQPAGIVTRLYGVTSRWSSHSTNSAFTATDLINTQNTLGPRFQQNASWVGSLNYLNRIRAMGDTNYFGRSVTLDGAVSETVLGKSAYESSDMSTALNTVTNPALVYGDFDGYVIADRVGLAVEFVPQLFSTGNGLPNGRRGWYAHWRTGGDVISNTNFVLSVNLGA